MFSQNSLPMATHVFSSTWTVHAWFATRVAVDRSKLLRLRSTPRASPAPTTARAADGGANARRAGKAFWLEMSDAAGRPTAARGATPEISDAAGRATAPAADGGANARRAGKACWLERSDAAGRPTVARGATPDIRDAAGRAMGARVATPETSDAAGRAAVGRVATPLSMDLETRPGAATLNLSKPKFTPP